jgi:hypothetical protein
MSLRRNSAVDVHNRKLENAAQVNSFGGLTHFCLMTPPNLPEKGTGHKTSFIFLYNFC